jgi:rhombotail lipoprotein
MKRVTFICAVAMLAVLSGCTVMHTQSRGSSSLVSFLYPASGPPPPPENAIPELRVPMRVGLAMLPSTYGYNTAPLDATQKQEFLEQIRERFLSRRFVSEIIVIPDYYLTHDRGFVGLEGVQRLYDVDAIALVSYDQVTHRDDNPLALGYLTIIGAYVLPGTSHETVTLVDLAVVDPVTRSLVLRAGGTDTRAGRATLVNLDRESRKDGAAGFLDAGNQMIENFDAALTTFESEVRAGTTKVRVVSQNGYGGAGAFGIPELLILLAGSLAHRKSRAKGAQERAPCAARAPPPQPQLF